MSLALLVIVYELELMRQRIAQSFAPNSKGIKKMGAAMDKHTPTIIGDCTLYLGDCMDILPTLGKVDACVTDPPYGLAGKWKGGKSHTKAGWKLSDGGDAMSWDSESPDLSKLIDLGCDTIVWGGNYFALPISSGWLLWDKIVREFTSGHAELAWTNLDQPVRAYNYSHGQLASEGKEHPTQKPLALMEWCLSFLPKAKTILDPFMGSGTTGLACIRTGRKFIGIEKEPRYFEIACKRIKAEYERTALFEPVPQATTASLFKEEECEQQP